MHAQIFLPTPSSLLPPSLSLFPSSLPPFLSPSLLSSHEGQVRHYHIKHEDAKYYISDKHRFATIKELIEYHKLNGGGLVTRLRKPPMQLLPQLNTLSPLFGRELCHCLLAILFIHVHVASGNGEYITQEERKRGRNGGRGGGLQTCCGGDRGGGDGHIFFCPPFR